MSDPSRTSVSVIVEAVIGLVAGASSALILRKLVHNLEPRSLRPFARVAIAWRRALRAEDESQGRDVLMGWVVLVVENGDKVVGQAWDHGEFLRVHAFEGSAPAPTRHYVPRSSIVRWYQTTEEDARDHERVEAQRRRMFMRSDRQLLDAAERADANDGKN